MSWITIEKHDAAGTESADTVESADTTIEITSGVNDTFAFRHSLALTYIYTTYTISLDERVYTTDELVTALNAAIEEQGSVAFTLTTSIAYIDGRFTIRCSSTMEHPCGNEIMSGATAAVSLGFAQDQTAGVLNVSVITPSDLFGSYLDLVAANTPPPDSAEDP